MSNTSDYNSEDVSTYIKRKRFIQKEYQESVLNAKQRHFDAQRRYEKDMYNARLEYNQNVVDLDHDFPGFNFFEHDNTEDGES